MTMMVHYLYHQSGEEFEKLGEIDVSHIHWLVAPSWLASHPKVHLDWGTTRVLGMTKAEVQKLVFELPRHDRKFGPLHPVFEKALQELEALVNGLDETGTYAVEWVECY